MVEKKVFGIKTTEAVLSGSDYVAICGVIMIPLWDGNVSLSSQDIKVGCIFASTKSNWLT